MHRCHNRPSLLAFYVFHSLHFLTEIIGQALFRHHSVLPDADIFINPSLPSSLAPNLVKKRCRHGGPNLALAKSGSVTRAAAQSVRYLFWLKHKHARAARARTYASACPKNLMIMCEPPSSVCWRANDGAWRQVSIFERVQASWFLMCTSISSLNTGLLAFHIVDSTTRGLPDRTGHQVRSSHFPNFYKF